MRAPILIMTIVFALAFCATFDWEQVKQEEIRGYCELIQDGGSPIYNEEYEGECR